MSSIDYNIDNYTVSELFAILGLDDPTSDDIMNETNKYIRQFSPSGENQPNLVRFFQSIQTKLLRYMQQLDAGEDAEYTPDETQTDDWWKNEALTQTNSIQNDKITDRKQKIDIYDNNHLPMNREQLGINNNFNVPVAQDKLNPNLANVTSRFINLDSQYRQASGGSETMSTDYTMDLSDPLTNVLSLRLYSIQIPYTWYVIDYIYGNTCFWVTNSGNVFKIFLEPGNYGPNDFCVALNNAFTTVANFNKCGETWTKAFTYPSSPAPTIVTYNSNNGKVTINLNRWIDPANKTVQTITQYDDTFDSTKHAYFTFFDITGEKSCYECGTNPCGNGQRTVSSSLGWTMGFRLPLQPVFSGGNTPAGVLNLYGTKYFIVVLDDYNQNHINNGLITITQLSKSLSIPSYYNTSQPYFCTTVVPANYNIDDVGNLSNISPSEAAALGVNMNNLFTSLQDKVDFGTSNVQQLLPSAPRTLTQAQIYTVNEIIKNRSKTTTFRAKAPTNSDTFAIIPIKYGSLSTGQLYTELSGQFQDNKRIYFGPVNIDRLRIRLLDDKGTLIDLHGSDWCVTLISENLYQY
jgi:hypothetical protein